MEAVTGKKEIITQLKKQILSMEGFSSGSVGCQLDFGLGPMSAAFPNGVFPIGAIHEFVSLSATHAAAANGFLANLVRTLMGKSGTCLWIGAQRKVFPPALKSLGIEPHRIIFIDVKRPKEILWVMEQALKCTALSAVVSELREVTFAESRRLQLAVEQSRVTGFLHRIEPYTKSTLACVSRWKISPLASQTSDGLPGVGFPRLQVELEKIRNGRPGTWQFEWQEGNFRILAPQIPEILPASSTRKKWNYA